MCERCFREAGGVTRAAGASGCGDDELAAALAASRSAADRDLGEAPKGVDGVDGSGMCHLMCHLMCGLDLKPPVFGPSEAALEASKQESRWGRGGGGGGGGGGGSEGTVGDVELELAIAASKRENRYTRGPHADGRNGAGSDESGSVSGDAVVDLISPGPVREVFELLSSDEEAEPGAIAESLWVCGRCTYAGNGVGDRRCVMCAQSRT